MRSIVVTGGNAGVGLALCALAGVAAAAGPAAEACSACIVSGDGGPPAARWSVSVTLALVIANSRFNRLTRLGGYGLMVQCVSRALEYSRQTSK